MQPSILGQTLRSWREISGLGPIKIACKALGVSHSTLGMYERGELLPDVDFLAKFSDRTGADFDELLQHRLLVGKSPEARQLAHRRSGHQENAGPCVAESDSRHRDHVVSSVIHSLGRASIYVSPELLSTTMTAAREVIPDSSSGVDQTDLILKTHAYIYALAKDPDKLELVTVDEAAFIMKLILKIA